MGRIKFQNSRQGALAAVLGLTVLGFALGIALLVLAPMIRAGKGPFAFLNRPGSAALDARRLGSQPALGAPVKGDRPELWRTPVALQAFPDEGSYNQVATTTGVARVVYNPSVDRRILPMPPVQDAVGRSLLFVVVTFGADDDTRTPGPYRPAPDEATRLTIVASGNSEIADPAGCLLSLAAANQLRVTGTLGGVSPAECQAGMIPVSDQQVVSFRVRYDLLPNYRAQDGSWRDGGVLGRTEVVATTAARGTNG